MRRLLHYPSFLLFLFIALTTLGSNTMQLSANTFLPSSTFSPSVFSPALGEKKTGKERALEAGDTQQAGAYRTMESPRVRYSQRTRPRGVWMIPACPLPLLPGSSSRKVPDYCLAPESVYVSVYLFSFAFQQGQYDRDRCARGRRGALGCPSGWVGRNLMVTLSEFASGSSVFRVQALRWLPATETLFGTILVAGERRLSLGGGDKRLLKS